MATSHGLTRKQWAGVYAFQIARTYRDVFGAYPAGLSYGEQCRAIVDKIGRAEAFDRIKRQPQHCPAEWYAPGRPTSAL